MHHLEGEHTSETVFSDIRMGLRYLYIQWRFPLEMNTFL